MLGDRDIDVKDRVKTALSHFQATGSANDMPGVRTTDLSTMGGVIDGRVVSTDYLVMAHLAAAEDHEF